MTHCCDYCDRRGELREVDVTDESGASFARLCGRCRTLMAHARCRFCGAPKLGESKAGVAYLHGRQPENTNPVPICDDCRHKMVIGGGDDEYPRRVGVSR